MGLNPTALTKTSANLGASPAPTGGERARVGRIDGRALRPVNLDGFLVENAVLGLIAMANPIGPARSLVVPVRSNGDGAFLIAESKASHQTEDSIVAHATTKDAAIALARNPRASDHAADRVKRSAAAWSTPHFHGPVWETFGGPGRVCGDNGREDPARAHGTPAEVAERSLFPLSDAASLMTRQAPALGGGELIS